MTVPLALLMFASRVLNPSLVIVEVALNAYVLWVNRDAVPRIRSRVRGDRDPVSSLVSPSASRSLRASIRRR